MSGNQDTPVDETVESPSEETTDMSPENLVDTDQAGEAEQTNVDHEKTDAKADSNNADAQNNDIDDKEIAALRAEVRRNVEGWQRTLAEFQNYKRRVEREQKDLREKIALETIGKMLHIIDDFERAMANMPTELEENPWTNGVKLIRDKFGKLLDEHNIDVIDPKGELFDPNQHQAVARDDSDEYASDHVIETLQKGYQSGDMLLRPALVRIAN